MEWRRVRTAAVRARSRKQALNSRPAGTVCSPALEPRSPANIARMAPSNEGPSGLALFLLRREAVN